MSHASSQARRSRLGRSTTLVAALGVAAALTATAITPAVAADAPEGDAPTDPRVVLEENFDDNTLPAGFNAVSGDWKVEGGKLVGDSQTGNLSRITFGEHLADFRMEATVRIDRSLNATRWQAFALDMPADGSTPWSQAAMRTTTTAANGLEFALRTAGNQWVVPSTASAPIDAGIGNEVKVAIEVHRGQGTWFFNGEQRMVSQQVSRFDAGIQGFVVADATVSYDDLKITELEPLPILDLREPGESATVTGHRGYSSIAPENTLPATIASRKAGADFTEVDIDFTKDNVPVIMHDDTVDRTTDGTGKIRDMMFSEFEGLDAGSWYSPEFTGTPVPTLEDLLKDLSTNGGKPPARVQGRLAPGAGEDRHRHAPRVRHGRRHDRAVLRHLDDRQHRGRRSGAAERDPREQPPRQPGRVHQGARRHGPQPHAGRPQGQHAGGR